MGVSPRIAVVADYTSMENKTKERHVRAVMEIAPEHPSDLEFQTEVIDNMRKTAKRAGLKVRLVNPGSNGHPVFSVEGPRNMVENWIPMNYGTSYDMSLIREIV